MLVFSFATALISTFPILCFLLIIGVIVYFAYKKLYPTYLKNKESNQKYNLKYNIEPYIKIYLHAYTASWSSWPSKISLSPYDYQSIRTLLETENKIDTKLFTEQEFKDIVDELLTQEAFNLFETNFMSKLSTNLTTENLIETYYALFGLNHNYVSFLSKLAKKQGIFISNNEIKSSLIELTHQLAIKNRTTAIQNALFTNSSMVKNVDIEYIDSLDGVSFEKILKNIFQKMGYLVHTTKSSGDQGADLLLSKEDIRIIVQAKRYSHPVSNTAVQEAVAAKAYYNYSQAMVVTNNYFTKGAIELAAANEVELIDRDKLKTLIETYPIPKDGF